MGDPAERIPTFDELYQAIAALPPGLTGEIFEPGTIRTMGRPGGTHRLSARAIWRSLGQDDRFERGLGWWFEQEAESRFGERPPLQAWGNDRRQRGGEMSRNPSKSFHCARRPHRGATRKEPHPRALSTLRRACTMAARPCDFRFDASGR